MPLVRLSAIDGDAILPLADAKAHVRVFHSREDELIASLRNAAVSHVERLSGVALAPASFRWEMQRFPGPIELPMGPVTALSEVGYKDADGADQTYGDARLIGNRVYPAAGSSWPLAYDSVSVTFTAGLSDPTLAPELITAAKLLAAHYYANREGVTVGTGEPSELPLGVSALIDSYRQVRV